MSSLFWLFFFCALVSLCHTQGGSDAPVFEPLLSPGGVTFTVKERAREGTEVGLVRAQGLPQETVLYGLEELEDELEGAFQIGASSGEITVGSSGPNLLVIDGAPVSVTFRVFAYYESAGLSGNRSNLSVTVELEDVNDSPYFEEDVETEIFVEAVEVGDVLGRISATDSDLGVNAALEYSLQQIRPNGDSEDLFSIHRYTGDLIVMMSLSLGYKYCLTITATDEGEPALSASINITVLVVPLPPVFTQSVYEVELLEFTDQIGVSVVNISATSPDGNTVAYSITEWTPAPEGLNFTVGSSTGALVASGTLDRETFSRYTITVQAYAYVGSPTEATVVLHVGDVNEPPRFSRSHYSASVSEEAELGTLFYSSVTATDRDESSNSEVTYSVGSVMGLTTADGARHTITDDIFTIDSSTAELFVNSDLEREAQEEDYHYYEITVIATDGGSPPLSASSVVAVTVTDVNDNPPVFSASVYSYDVLESVGEGTAVGTVQVSDRDEGRAANISFSLTGLGSNLFRISVLGVSHPQMVQARPPTVTTGRIYTIGQLDREQVSQYDLTVVAQDTTDQPLSGSAQVTITILDYNDNAPEFDKDTFTFEVEEESLFEDGVVGTLTAIDYDEGSNALFDFSLVVGAREREIFYLEANGSTVELRLLQALDRETYDSFSLRLQAMDRGSPSLVGETTINITVLDVNDERPVFSEARYEVNVTEGTEGGTSLLSVSASDDDIGENADLMYSVEGGVVSVSGESGEVQLVMVLDHEESNTLEIQVMATDSGNPPLVGSATIVINVLDINDNAPIFENTAYSVVVYENVTIGAELIRVVASDADSGERGSIRYTLSGSESEQFAIGETSGAVTLSAALDREEKVEYQLLITASDMGSPSRSSLAQLLITVSDVNDNSPVFQQSSYTVQVSEGVVVNSSLGEEVVTVAATDDDSGSNGEISYLLSGSGADTFTIDSTGLVTVAQPLDYETFPGPYVLTVIARDNGESSRSAAVTLEVMVTDANDNAPTFLGVPYVIRLEDGTMGPLSVLVASATDPDTEESGEVEFALIGGRDLFVVDSFGILSVVEGRQVDREGGEGGEVGEVGEGGEGIIRLTLTAVDNGLPIQISQTSVTVLVSDVNDNQPVFQQSSYSTTVSEAEPISSDILNLLATDSDNGINASVIYTIEHQEPQLTEPVFTMDSQTGVLSLSSPLDRETHNFFTLSVSARDRGTPSLSSSVTVTVNVSDANDNHPVFTIPPGGYTSTLSEDSSLGSEVVTVVATDRDLGLHSQITYSLRDPSSVPFQIQDPEIGTISVSAPLDRETISQYSLVVVASDTAANTNSSLQTEAVVTVTVLDVNDNAPQFIASSFEGRVSEDTPTNTTVSLFPDILAVDSDTAPNGVITYTLTGNDAQYFSLNPTTALLTTAALFDAEVLHTYRDLQVVATDNGGLSSSVPLTVVIEDVNDFTPFFTIGANTTVTVSEALSPGDVVIVVTASDSDGRDNVLVFSLGGYVQEGVDGELTSGNPFIIDSATGAIAVGDAGLDFEMSSYYILTVNVEDSGTPPQSNSTQIVVVLTDVNDNSPIFIPEFQSFYVVENSPTGSLVGGVAVSDADSEVLTQLQYLIIGGNERGLFAIESTSGEITTAADIDREEGETYSLIIEARDDVTLFRAGTGTAVVTVDDVNDQAPVFPAPLTVVEFEEEQPAGTSVVVFAASDGDAGENGTLSYQIISSEPAQHFTINSLTGEIFTAIQVDRETHNTYFLIIQANDGGNPSLTGTASVTISLTDINDNSPEFNGSLEATIVENPLPGSLLSRNYSAYDRDEGSNAELTWEIVSGNIFDAFRVDPTTGDLYAQNTTELDFETTPVIFLELVVTDLGEPPLPTSLLVRVSLEDANDHAPVVSPLPPLTLPEDTPTDSIVAVVTATDEDTGSNAELQFVILTGNTGGVFTMRSDGGLRVSSPLDYESVTRYELVIEAHDRGTPPMIGSITVVINVTDVNDNAPQFVNLHLSETIPEDQMNPQIAAPTIRDVDSGSNGLYDLRVLSANGGDPAPFFAIFNLVAADGTLDYEEENQYTLVLEATDRGVPSLTTTVEITVDIEDRDDNPPTFPEPPRYVLPEDQSILTPFTVLQTEDRDTPENSAAYYYITGGATTEYFDIISQTGQLYLNQLVDRETVPVHTLEITAQSFLGDASGCTELSCSVTTLTVTLADVNDNTPQWSLREYIIGVNQTTPPGALIGRIEAGDADADGFGLVWYRLTAPMATPLVTLEEETGVLRLNQSLSLLQFRVSTVFTAVAFDNRGLPPSSISMNVPIRIVSVSEEYLVVLTISQSLDEIQADVTELQRVVESVPGARLSVYDIRETSAVSTEDTAGGGVVKRQQSPETDVVLFGLSSDGGQLLTSQQTLDVISDNVSVFGDLYIITTVKVFPVPESEDDSEELDRLTLTIVVASVVVGVLLAVLLVTLCGCCWLQNRLKQKRKYYEPGRRSDRQGHHDQRESVRYSTADGVELYGDNELFRDSWGGGRWGEEEEEDMFRPKEVTMREGDRRRRDRGATDSGTRSWDSRGSGDSQRSVLYESKDYVMDVFEDSDVEDEGMEASPAGNLAGEGSEEAELQNRVGYGLEGEGEEEDDVGPMIRPQSHLEDIPEAEEEEEEEEEEERGEWEDGTTGAEVWEEREGGGEEWGEEEEPSPADMMTEEEARMLAAPLEEEELPPADPLLF